MNPSGGIQETAPQAQDQGQNRVREGHLSDNHEHCRGEINNLNEELSSQQEQCRGLLAENEELKKRIESLQNEIQEERTNAQYQEQTLKLSLKEKRDELEASDRIIKSKEAEITQRDAMLVDLQERKQFTQELNASFVECRRREQNALDTISRLQAELETLRGREANYLHLKTKYEEKKKEQCSLQAEVDFLKIENERLKRLSSGKSSRFSVEPVSTMTPGSSEESILETMSTDVTPTNSSREGTPEPQPKRGRFVPEPVMSPKCKNCHKILDETELDDSPCFFHMSSPQTFNSWKDSHPEKACQSRYQNCLFWPCCGKFDRKTPTGCQKLKSHQQE